MVQLQERSDVMKKRKYVYMGMGILTAGILAALSYEQNHALDIQMHMYKNDKIPQPFNGYRILHISDLHDASFGKNQKNILKKVQLLQPDVIFLTGDMIDCRKTTRRTIQKNFMFIEGLRNIAPMYYVPGNHEATSPLYGYFKQFLFDKGVHIVENGKIALMRKEKSITLLGVKDPKFYYVEPKRFEQHVAQLCTQIDTSFCMLLSHRPEKLEVYAKYGIHLVFCGHAHGGQIRFADGRGMYAPNQGIFPKYTSGFYTLGDCTMHVSRGLGNSRAPQRIHNHPHLALITLQTT